MYESGCKLPHVCLSRSMVGCKMPLFIRTMAPEPPQLASYMTLGIANSIPTDPRTPNPNRNLPFPKPSTLSHRVQTRLRLRYP